MNMQWTLDDIAALNPTDSPQNTSFLDRLLDFAATSEGLLVEFAEVLESRNGPFVVVFGQLPYDLGLGSIKLAAPGDRINSSVELWARPVTLTFDAFGRVETPERAELASTTHATITQLAGVVRLEDKRARVHPVYAARLNNLQLLEAPLASHMVEHWMPLPEVSLAEPHRRRRPLTGRDCQRDVAARVKDHQIFATRALLKAYSISALIDMRDKDYLYGYHAMIAPGRLAAAGTLVPVLKGLIDSNTMPGVLCGSLMDARSTIQNVIRTENPFIR
jgi:hypothetical protein